MRYTMEKCSQVGSDGIRSFASISVVVTESPTLDCFFLRFFIVLWECALLRVFLLICDIETII